MSRLLRVTIRREPTIMTERERAEQYVQTLREDFTLLDDPVHKGWLSIRPSELIDALLAIMREERARAMEEAARVSCYMCREGMPLQRNGYRHNDKNGKDTVINNLCNGAVFLQRAKALREEGGRGTD